MAAVLAGVRRLNGPFVASESRGSFDVTRREWSGHCPPALPAPSHCPLVDGQHLLRMLLDRKAAGPPS
jgi:hypothetical protein